jgi:paraquat-inducible protein B
MRASRVADLVAQGLTAQLSMQSLLTGLLYVDLDLRPAGVVTATPRPRTGRRRRGLPEIPTVANTIQALQKQLQTWTSARWWPTCRPWPPARAS